VLALCCPFHQIGQVEQQLKGWSVRNIGGIVAVLNEVSINLAPVSLWMTSKNDQVAAQSALLRSYTKRVI
jgi:hypothetical protein